MAGVGRSSDRRKEGKRTNLSKDPRDEDAKANPRNEAGEVLQIYRNGDLDTALDLCLDMTINKYKLSPPPLLSNLLGYLCMKASLFAGEASPELAQRCAKHALDSYSKAAEAVPNCIETATSHGEALSALKLYRLAEVELNRALSIARPLDPAVHNIMYGVDLPDKATKNNRIAAAKEKLHRAIDINHNSICDDGVTNVLNIIASEGALSAVQTATTVATSFPRSARAQCLPAFVALKVAQGLRPDIDNTELLHCALNIMDKAANDFDCSLMIALFRAKLMVVFGDYGAAERECYRALRIDKPDDPKAHEIPFGSIKGEEYDDRICSVKRQIHGLLQSLVLFATRDWSLMTNEGQGMILSVRADVLREYYHTISRALSEVISNAQSFVSSGNCWILRVCPHPNCKSIGKFHTVVMFWQHIINAHFGSMSEELHAFSDPKICENVMEGDCSLDVISFSKDSDQQDIFYVKNMEDLFGTFILDPFSMTEITQAVEMQKNNQKEGNEIIKMIKKKLRSLPSNRSSNEFFVACKKVQEMCSTLIKKSSFDYREIILPLTRSYQWEQLKKYLSQREITSCLNNTDKDLHEIFVNAGCTPEWNAYLDSKISHAKLKAYLLGQCS